MMKNLAILSILLTTHFSLSAQSATDLIILDTRGIDSPPSAYSRQAKIEFKARSAINVPGAGYYSGLLTIAPWGDFTGNNHHQLNFNDGGIFYRQGLFGSAWQGWSRILMENEIGRVGIGTTSPSLRLDVCGDFGLPANSGNIATGMMRVGHANHDWAGTELNFGIVNDDLLNYAAWIQAQCPQGYGLNRTLLLNPNGGNVAIGLTNPGNYRLNVAGKIRAEEIIVNTSGADFVFDPGYNLPNLSEIERFIKENRHLPEIRPARELADKGMSISEMQTKLLQKIEELTLYIIDQQKEIEILKNEMSEIKKP